MGLFEHRQSQGYPLSTLGVICYLLTASEIHDATGSRPWLQERLRSLESAAAFLLTLLQNNGLIGGSGFYIERHPPRLRRCHAMLRGACVPPTCRPVWAGEGRPSQNGLAARAFGAGLQRTVLARITSANTFTRNTAWWMLTGCPT